MSGAQTQDGVFVVPVIDIAPFRSGSVDGRARVAEAVDHAAREVGFMQIVGHGIAPEFEAGLTSAMDAFFARPAQEKLALRPENPLVNRGYSGPQSESLTYSLGVQSAKDLFEAFNVGASAADYPGRVLPTVEYADNLWPSEEFRSAITAWFDAVARVARELTAVFAVALGLPTDHFDAVTDHSIDVLRMNNYRMPSGDVRLEPGQMGMGAHTDYGIVTVLWADAVTPGLQILDADGRWHDVVPVPGALLVNLGDALARWTNDRWISTMHRVLAPVDADGRLVHRRSAAFFHDGNVDAVIACLPGCADESNPPKYEPVTVGDHLAAKLGGSRVGTLNTKAEREASRLRSAF